MSKIDFMKLQNGSDIRGIALTGVAGVDADHGSCFPVGSLQLCGVGVDLV